MAKTFKQQVEDIQCELCNWKEDGCEYKPDVCPAVKVTTDRILAAHNAELDRIAEGTPKGLAEDDGTDWQLGVRHGIQCQYNEGRAYIQAQKGS